MSEHNLPGDPPNFKDAALMLWNVLSNVNDGDWTQQSSAWQIAAARWQTYYEAAKQAEMGDER